MDNRGKTIREIQYHCHPDTPDIIDERILRHQFNAIGQRIQSIDSRLYARLQEGEAVKPNFTYHSSLSRSVLRTDSVDAGITWLLNDIAGRPALRIQADGSKRTWQYAEPALLGNLLSITEQPKGGADTIMECFVWATNSPEMKGNNLAGQCICHYDTAGLKQTESMALTGTPLSVIRQLLNDKDAVDWQGKDESTWQGKLNQERFATQCSSDATGALLTQIDPKGNRQRLAYGSRGLLKSNWLKLNGKSEQIIVKSLDYSAAAQKRREEHGNGVVTAYFYEPETQRLIGIKTERSQAHILGAKVFQELRYQYDPIGNLLRVTNESEANQFWRNQCVEASNTYVYDSLYQLVSASGREMASMGQQSTTLPTPIIPFPTDCNVYTRYTRAYHYDRGGNLTRIRHSAPASQHNYTTNITVSTRSNRAVLSSLTEDATQVDRLFDAGGHQQQLIPGQELVWTLRGELRQVTPVSRNGQESDRERYRYDGNNQRLVKIRMQKTSNSTQMQRVVYLPGLELRTTQAGDNHQTKELHVVTVGEAGRAQVRVLQWEKGKPEGIDHVQLRYSYDNLIGGASLEVDGEGNLITHEEYYPYGGTAILVGRSQIEVDEKTFRYSGKERDATGLYYYGYRYYQPWVGRWLSVDPAGTVDGVNLFRMVRNNPVNFVDNNGLAPIGNQHANGLFEPKLRTGNARDLPGASYPESPTDIHTPLNLSGNSVSLYEALRPKALSESPFLTDLINPQKAPLSPDAKKILSNREGGGQFFFGAIKVEAHGKSYHALEIVEHQTADAPESVYAHWLPQGGYVDIPVTPKEDDPQFVFTPAFSGCSLTVDQLDDNTLRARHVQGKKEDEEYNNSAIYHGDGLVNAMEYPDYGYHKDKSGMLIENIYGAAFLQYLPNAGGWVINSQGIVHSPSIKKLEKKYTGLFWSKMEIETNFSRDARVVQTQQIKLPRVIQTKQIT